MRHDYLRAHLKLDPRINEQPEHVVAFCTVLLNKIDQILSGEPVESASPEIELLGKIGARRQ